ncbi:MAG TPA: hypothetical protein VFJ47_08375, partial [Terriglobales bacterium]|nr:hypothetical protein [Terriglobales bacterium]
TGTRISMVATATTSTAGRVPRTQSQAAEIAATLVGLAGLGGLEELEEPVESAAPVVLAELAESAVRVVSAELVAPAELGASAVLAVSVDAGMARPNCRRAAVGPGSIIRNTAGELPIATARLQTGSAGRRGVTRSLIAKTKLGNKSAARAATWAAIEVVPESATEPEPEQATGLAEAMGLGLTDLAVAEETGLAVVTFRAAVGETAMLSEAGREAMTGPMRAPAAAAAHRVREVAGEAAGVEVGAAGAVVVVDEHPLVHRARPTGAGNELII